MQRDGGYHSRTTPARVVKFVPIGEREIRVVASTAAVDRYGDILEPLGCQYRNFLRNPCILAQHDAAMPIARCTDITAAADAVRATIAFPPQGTSARSDEYLRLIKAGIVSAVSVGFLPISWEPLRDGGLRHKTWELLEISCVSIGANADALVSERAFNGARRARDLQRAERVLARTAAARRDQSAEAQRARAAALKARLSREPDWTARAEHEEELRRRDRGAAYDAAIRLSW